MSTTSCLRIWTKIPIIPRCNRTSNPSSNNSGRAKRSRRRIQATVPWTGCLWKLCRRSAKKTIASIRLSTFLSSQKCKKTSQRPRKNLVFGLLKTPTPNAKSMLSMQWRSAHFPHLVNQSQSKIKMWVRVNWQRDRNVCFVKKCYSRTKATSFTTWIRFTKPWARRRREEKKRGESQLKTRGRKRRGGSWWKDWKCREKYKRRRESRRKREGMNSWERRRKRDSLHKDCLRSNNNKDRRRRRKNRKMISRQRRNRI